jgi:hypothetical protein
MPYPLMCSTIWLLPSPSTLDACDFLISAYLSLSGCFLCLGSTLTFPNLLFYCNLSEKSHVTVALTLDSLTLEITQGPLWWLCSGDFLGSCWLFCEHIYPVPTASCVAYFSKKMKTPYLAFCSQSSASM